jgi:hypothetical protein
MVDGTIASKKPFPVPICNDGCRGVGNGANLPEEKIFNILELMADGDGRNPYCVSKDTVFTVERSGNETFEFASECTSKVQRCSWMYSQRRHYLEFYAYE